MWKYIAQISCVVAFVFCFLKLPHMSLYLVVTYGKKNDFWTLSCFSCLAVLNKAILDTLIHIFVFLYAVALLGRRVDTQL